MVDGLGEGGNLTLTRWPLDVYWMVAALDDLEADALSPDGTLTTNVGLLLVVGGDVYVAGNSYAIFANTKVQMLDLDNISLDLG